MKELTEQEKVLAGKLYDSGYGVLEIEKAIYGRRESNEHFYLLTLISKELGSRVTLDGEGHSGEKGKWKSV